MAAPRGNQNAVGNSGGKSKNDRELAAEVRSLTLNKIKTLFEMEDKEMSNRQRILHDRILEKLAGSVLPRLNEHTGEDGGEIKVSITNYGNSPTASLPAENVSASTPASD